MYNSSTITINHSLLKFRLNPLTKAVCKTCSMLDTNIIFSSSYIYQITQQSIFKSKRQNDVDLLQLHPLSVV